MIRKTDHHRTITSVSLVAPAIRLVVVEAWAERAGDGWEAEHSVFPVVALQATAGAAYTRRFDERRPPRISPNHTEMEAFGWHYDSVQCVEFDAIISDPNYGLCEAGFALDCVNSVHEIVACPWPESEDAERLRPVIERVGKEAIEKARREQTPEPSASVS